MKIAATKNLFLWQVLLNINDAEVWGLGGYRVSSFQFMGAHGSL